MRITGTRRGHDGKDEVTLGNLKEGEVDKIEAFVLGYQWVSTDGEGGLITREVKEPLPDPTVDSDLIEYWPKVREPVQMELFPPTFKASHPRFIIQSLCGYDFSKDNYALQVKKLTSYGFECLRSRRGEDGKRWEMWYLPGAWAAEGELKRHLKELEKKPVTHSNEEFQKAENRKNKAVISFLCHNASFGTLDITEQRAAMTIDD